MRRCGQITRSSVTDLGANTGRVSGITPVLCLLDETWRLAQAGGIRCLGEVIPPSVALMCQIRRVVGKCPHTIISVGDCE